MKRELKAKFLFEGFEFPHHAAAQIPMKRELKDIQSGCCFGKKDSCSPNPYEEGTERQIFIKL